MEKKETIAPKGNRTSGSSRVLPLPITLSRLLIMLLFAQNSRLKTVAICDGNISGAEKQQGCKVRFCNTSNKTSGLLELQDFFLCRWLVSPNTVPVWLDRYLNSSTSHFGVKKIMCFLKYNIGFTPFCFCVPDLTQKNHNTSALPYGTLL